MSLDIFVEIDMLFSFPLPSSSTQSTRRTLTAHSRMMNSPRFNSTRAKVIHAACLMAQTISSPRNVPVEGPKLFYSILPSLGVP